MTNTLSIPVDENGYGFKEGAAVSRVETKGGRSRIRSDLNDTSIIVNCVFSLTPSEYDVLKAFYDTNQAVAFNIPLPIDSSAMDTQTAFFASELSILQVFGFNLKVGVTLEVLPQAANLVNDAAIVAAYNSVWGL